MTVVKSLLELNDDQRVELAPQMNEAEGIGDVRFAGPILDSPFFSEAMIQARFVGSSNRIKD